MAFETLKILSGEDRGSGQGPHFEGFIRSYMVEGDWITIFEVDRNGNQLRVGKDDVIDRDPDPDHLNNIWQSYLSFDLTGVDVSRVLAVRLGLFLEGNVVSDPPLWESNLSIRYGHDAWSTRLKDIYWNRAGTQWPAAPSGWWEPDWDDWAVGSSEYLVHTATVLDPITSFTGTLFQMRLQLATFLAGMGQYTLLHSGNAAKEEPYLELDLEVDVFPGKEQALAHANIGKTRGQSRIGAAMATIEAGSARGISDCGKLAAHQDRGIIRGR